MAADGGSVFFWGQPLTQWEKRIAGSDKMASDGGGVIFGGTPLTQVGKSRGAVGQHKEETAMVLEMWLLIRFDNHHLRRSDRDRNTWYPKGSVSKWYRRVRLVDKSCRDLECRLSHTSEKKGSWVRRRGLFSG